MPKGVRNGVLNSGSNTDAESVPSPVSLVGGDSSIVIEERSLSDGDEIPTPAPKKRARKSVTQPNTRPSTPRPATPASTATNGISSKVRASGNSTSDTGKIRKGSHSVAKDGAGSGVKRQQTLKLFVKQPKPCPTPVVEIVQPVGETIVVARQRSSPVAESVVSGETETGQNLTKITTPTLATFPTAIVSSPKTPKLTFKSSTASKSRPSTLTRKASSSSTKPARSRRTSPERSLRVPSPDDTISASSREGSRESESTPADMARKSGIAKSVPASKPSQGRKRRAADDLAINFGTSTAAGNRDSLTRGNKRIKIAEDEIFVFREPQPAEPRPSYRQFDKKAMPTQYHFGFMPLGAKPPAERIEQVFNTDVTPVPEEGLPKDTFIPNLWGTIGNESYKRLAANNKKVIQSLQKEGVFDDDDTYIPIDVLAIKASKEQKEKKPKKAVVTVPKAPPSRASRSRRGSMPATTFEEEEIVQNEELRTDLLEAALPLHLRSSELPESLQSSSPPSEELEPIITSDDQQVSLSEIELPLSEAEDGEKDTVMILDEEALDPEHQDGILTDMLNGVTKLRSEDLMPIQSLDSKLQEKFKGVVSLMMKQARDKSNDESAQLLMFMLESGLNEVTTPIFEHLKKDATSNTMMELLNHYKAKYIKMKEDKEIELERKSAISAFSDEANEDAFNLLSFHQGPVIVPLLPPGVSGETAYEDDILELLGRRSDLMPFKPKPRGHRPDARDIANFENFENLAKSHVEPEAEFTYSLLRDDFDKKTLFPLNLTLDRDGYASHIPLPKLTAVSERLAKRRKLDEPESRPESQDSPEEVEEMMDDVVEGDGLSTSACTSCRESGGALVICDGRNCNQELHYLCANPPLTAEEVEAMPEWYCRSCNYKRRGLTAITASAQEKAIPLFGPLIAAMDKVNTRRFQLPLDVRNHFAGVATGVLGEYVEKVEFKNARVKKHKGYDYLYDEAALPIEQQLYDTDGRLITCYKCEKSKIHSRDNIMVKCDYCPFTWHLDCLPYAVTAPQAIRNGKMRMWKCPLHFTDDLLPMRRAKTMKVTDIIPSHLIDEEDPQKQFKDYVFGGEALRLPEKGIELNYHTLGALLDQNQDSFTRQELDSIYAIVRLDQERVRKDAVRLGEESVLTDLRNFLASKAGDSDGQMIEALNGFLAQREGMLTY